MLLLLQILDTALSKVKEPHAVLRLSSGPFDRSFVSSAACFRFQLGMTQLACVPLGAQKPARYNIHRDSTISAWVSRGMLSKYCYSGKSSGGTDIFQNVAVTYTVWVR